MLNTLILQPIKNTGGVKAESYPLRPLDLTPVVLDI